MVRAGTLAQGTRLLLGLGWVDTQCSGTRVCRCACESVHMGVCARAICMLVAAPVPVCPPAVDAEQCLGKGCCGLWGAGCRVLSHPLRHCLRLTIHTS